MTQTPSTPQGTPELNMNASDADAPGTEQTASASLNDAFYQVRTRAQQSFVLAIATLTGVAMMATTAALSVLPSTPTAEKLPAPVVTAHPSNLVLGCLDATIDPFNPLGSDIGDENAQAAPATLWVSSKASSTELLLGGKNADALPTQLDGRSWGIRATVASPLNVEATSSDASASASFDTSTAASQSNEAGTLSHAVTFVGQKGGELRGLSALPCSPPSLEHWFAMGATSTGEDTIIRVANTSSQSSVITLTAWGASGSLDQLSEGLVVPAGETLSIQPGRYFHNEERLLLRVSADGPGVSAWLHTSAMNGEVPQGSAWIGSTLPASFQVIPGMTAGSVHSLRLAVTALARADLADHETSATTDDDRAAGSFDAEEPHSQETPHSREEPPSQAGAAPSAQSAGRQSGNEKTGTAEAANKQAPSPQPADANGKVEVTLRLLDRNGIRDVPGGALTLAENSVLDVSLPEVSDTSALIIDASSPVVAQVLTQHPGTQWPSADGQATLHPTDNGQQHWKGRSALTATSAIGRLHIPSAADLDDAVTVALSAAIVRPTSVQTPADATVTSHELYCVNPTDKDLQIRYNSEEKVIPAGSSLSVPLADTAALLEADEAVYAAIIVRAELPTGAIDAVWPLGSQTLSGLTRAVDLR